MAERARILFAACRPPYPLDNGARIRTHRLLTGLARSFDVVLVTYEFGPEQPDGHVPRALLERHLPGVEIVTVRHRGPSKRTAQAASLARRESWTLGRYHSRAYAAAIAEAAARHRPAIVHFDDPGVALVTPPPGPLSVYSAHNIEQTLLRREALAGSLPRRAFNTLEARKVAVEEPRIWQTVDLCLAVSALDAAAMRAGGARRVELCPNGADPVERLPLAPMTAGEPLRLLFVGSGNYAPYERGLAWLVRDVLPLVRSQLAVRLDVVGAPPSQPLAAEGVSYIGRVPAVEPHYAAAHVVVVPVFEGSGTRLKIIEAAALGRPVVSTRVGAEGLPLRPGEHYLAADDAPAFAAAVVELAGRWRAPQESLERMLDLAHEAIQPLTWSRIVEQLAALYSAESRRTPAPRAGTATAPALAETAE
jgi:glycosyltransferase involved in cell wall biosynthesis